MGNWDVERWYRVYLAKRDVNGGEKKYNNGNTILFYSVQWNRVFVVYIFFLRQRKHHSMRPNIKTLYVEI